MNTFSKVFISCVLGSAIVLPYLASTRGWGLGTERKASVIASASKHCPDYQRDQYGRCRKSHRSYFRRSHRGGGFGRGK